MTHQRHVGPISSDLFQPIARGVLGAVLLLLALFAAPVAAYAENITPNLIAERPAQPGRDLEVAILMQPAPGWHGYWQNPGDAGLPMNVEWHLPGGSSASALRYPIPQKLTVAGLMNYVYEGPYAVLVRLRVPPDISGTFPVRADLRWLACTDKVCVPEQGSVALNIPVADSRSADPRFDEWRRRLPRPLTTPGRFDVAGGKIRVAIPLPQTVEIRDPYVFPMTDNAVDYEAPQTFRRAGDMVVAEVQAKGSGPGEFAGVLALADGSGFEFKALPGEVPRGGAPLTGLGASAVLWAVLGAIAGGILLNLMPCVFPILALKALHLSRAGGAEPEAKVDALAYAAGAIVGTGALGAVLLAIRAAGAEAGWAFQLQDPRTVVLLLLLAVAITANLVGLFELPVLAGRARPAGGFATGALAAFVATPCAGPFLGAALGTALLLPPAGAIAVFAALGLGLGVPFLLVSFVPPLRRKLPRPGAWMLRLQRFLAIPMAATAVACAWLLLRQTGERGLLLAAGAALLLGALLWLVGRDQRRGARSAWVPALLAVLVAAAAVWQAPARSGRSATQVAEGEEWSSERVEQYLAQGNAVFVNFTADWCLTCKANEAAAIDREAVQAAFKQNGVKVLVGDWTNGDPEITRFLESRGRAGVPLYIWYKPGEAPEELPQLLTPGMLISRAQRARQGQP